MNAPKRMIVIAIIIIIALPTTITLMAGKDPTPPVNKINAPPIIEAKIVDLPIIEDDDDDFKVNPMDDFIKNGIDWLAASQFENGGWGAGSHNNQHIRDPKKVKIDPGTTAFASMALLRAGHTPTTGKYSVNISKALNYLLEMVEASTENDIKITNVTGTQPQYKLGANIDATLTSQFFTRVIHYVDNDPELEQRVTKALDKCIRKIERSQATDGSWAAAGWAGNLQSSMAYNALELADNIGRPVDAKVMKKAKDYQEGNVKVDAKGKTSSVATGGSAGVQLYSIAGSQRSSAKGSRKAYRLIEQGKKEGKLLDDAEVTEENLMILDLPKEEAEVLYNSYEKNKATAESMNDDAVLAGFGNNGGEEFLSYMITSESMVITGGEDWTSWNNKMHTRLAKIQNKDGSWSGHHCITSPVYCTATVILTLSADLDRELLVLEDTKTDQN
ncbi:MAG: terpene cyclase/mutase family protein [Bacteroidetes bacterium]|nr:terpene cyclase/mutase family protein [Bacteroidota bacterium]